MLEGLPCNINQIVSLQAGTGSAGPQTWSLTLYCPLCERAEHWKSAACQPEGGLLALKTQHSADVSVEGGPL